MEEKLAIDSAEEIRLMISNYLSVSVASLVACLLAQSVIDRSMYVAFTSIAVVFVFVSFLRFRITFMILSLVFVLIGTLVNLIMPFAYGVIKTKDTMQLIFVISFLVATVFMPIVFLVKSIDVMKLMRDLTSKGKAKEFIVLLNEEKSNIKDVGFITSGLFIAFNKTDEHWDTRSKKIESYINIFLLIIGLVHMCYFSEVLFVGLLSAAGAAAAILLRKYKKPIFAYSSFVSFIVVLVFGNWYVNEYATHPMASSSILFVALLVDNSLHIPLRKVLASLKVAGTVGQAKTKPI